MPDNFFDSHAEAKQAMQENRFLEVYLSTSVAAPIHVKGWVTQPNPYQRHGRRWHLYVSRVELLRRLATRSGRNLPSRVEGGPA